MILKILNIVVGVSMFFLAYYWYGYKLAVILFLFSVLMLIERREYARGF